MKRETASIPHLLGAAVAYAATFWLIYVEYLNPVFDYAHYGRVGRSTLAGVVAMALAVAPVLARAGTASAASILADLIYVGYYVPSVLVLYFALPRDEVEVGALQFGLATGMVVIFLAAGLRASGTAPKRGRRVGVLVVVAAALVLLVVSIYREHMRLVSFEDVYDLRSETSEAVTSPILAYLLLWLAYCLLPLLLARWLFLGKRMEGAIGVVGAMVIYMATGAKASLLTPAIMVGLWVVLRSGRDFLATLEWVLVSASAVLVFLVPDEGPFMYVKSLLFMRTLGSTGWATYAYYDYFTQNGLTYLSHVGIVNAVTGAYRYGNLGLGQVIGVEYSGTAQANFNAGFWASDGIAAFGILGVVPISVAVGIYLVALNRCAVGCNPRFVGLWLSGFGMALLNVPFTTALISGGGVLALLIVGAYDVSGKAGLARPSSSGDTRSDRSQNPAPSEGSPAT